MDSTSGHKMDTSIHPLLPLEKSTKNIKQKLPNTLFISGGLNKNIQNNVTHLYEISKILNKAARLIVFHDNIYEDLETIMTILLSKNKKL